MRLALPFIPLLFLLACAPAEPPRSPDPAPAGTQETPLRPEARPTADAAQPSEPAAAPRPARGPLGRVVVSLGPLDRPGLWLETPLVDQAGRGRVEVPGGGAVDVALMPGAGGSRLSLEAMQTLGLPLTALTEVDVIGG